MSFETVVQAAIIEKLKANADIIAKTIPVYDEVPQVKDSGDDSGFPYIVAGDDSLLAWDTDTENGADVTITIHTWSRHRGKKQIKELQGYVYTALQDAEFTITGYESVVCCFNQSQSFLDVDGKTRHGVQSFNMLIEKT